MDSEDRDAEHWDFLFDNGMNVRPLPEDTAWTGFNVPQLNIESIRSNDHSSNDEEESPYFIIPEGISPEVLLESSDFISNSVMSQAIDPPALSGIEVSVRADNVYGNFGPSQVQSNEESGESIAGSQLRSVDTISASAEHSPPLSDQQNIEGGHSQTTDAGSIAGGYTGYIHEDGYHWRRYGQKQVIGSEIPRIYYRCKHKRCPVKKKVDRCPESGKIEIIYQGTHNHPGPAQIHVSSTGNSQFDSNPCQVIDTNGGDKGSVCGAAHPLGTRDWRNDSGEGDESESKRRETETFATEHGSGATKASHEPRVVFQTRSNVDILDDGFCWHKYGHKVVKGNPNPRSYYKCIHEGCNVRKYVERASNDLNYVITAYKGKHNHDVPAGSSS